MFQGNSDSTVLVVIAMVWSSTFSTRSIFDVRERARAYWSVLKAGESLLVRPLEVPHRAVGVPVAAVVELDALAQVEHPFLAVVRVGRPFRGGAPASYRPPCRSSTGPRRSGARRASSRRTGSPRRPWSGWPVQSGMSPAVIATRSTVSARADGAANAAPNTSAAAAAPRAFVRSVFVQCRICPHPLFDRARCRSQPFHVAVQGRCQPKWEPPTTGARDVSHRGERSP